MVLPYTLPLRPYSSSDEPWAVDVHHSQRDSFGRASSYRESLYTASEGAQRMNEEAEWEGYDTDE